MSQREECSLAPEGLVDTAVRLRILHVHRYRYVMILGFKIKEAANHED